LEGTSVCHLAAGFGVDCSAIENDFARFSCFQFVNRATLADDGLDARVLGLRRLIKVFLRLEGLRNFCECGARCFFCSALPRSTSLSALSLHRQVEFAPCNGDALIPRHIFEEITWQAECVVQPKRLASRYRLSMSGIPGVSERSGAFEPQRSANGFD